MLASYGDTAGLVNARLGELQKTIAELDGAIAGATTTMASVDTAATSVSNSGGRRRRRSGVRGAHHLASLDRSIAAVEKATTQDLPDIISDVRGSLVTVNQTIDQVPAT